MTTTKDVWFRDAYFVDASGTATFTNEETIEITGILSDAGRLFQSINPLTLNRISASDVILTYIKTFNNTKVRAGEKIANTVAHVEGLFHYIHDKFQKDIDAKKTEKGKTASEEKRKKLLYFFSHFDKKEIVKIFDLTNLLVDAKHMIIDKMNEAGHISTFLKTTNGFQTTGVEGFVAIDHLTGGAVKIVNRMEFSKSNFSPEIIKGWQR